MKDFVVSDEVFQAVDGVSSHTKEGFECLGCLKLGDASCPIDGLGISCSGGEITHVSELLKLVKDKLNGLMR